MYKLLSLIGLSIPCITGLPPVIYATSTRTDWRKLWKVHVDYDEVLDVCTDGDKQYLLKYSIDDLTGDRIRLEAFRGSGSWKTWEASKKIENAELMWTHGEGKFAIKDGDVGESSAVDVVYCKGSEGVFVNSGEKTNNQWRIGLDKLSEQFLIQQEKECLEYLFKVVCSVKMAESGVEKWGWKAKGTGQFTVNLKFPKLVYTPF